MSPVVNALEKMLIRSWDPDFTKVTPQEKEQIDTSVEEMEKGIYCPEEEVWSDTAPELP